MPSPNPSIPISDQAAPHAPSTRGDNDLWTQVYQRLPDELQQQLWMNGAAGKLQTLQDIVQAAIRAKEAHMAHWQKFKWVDKEIDVQEMADRLVGWVSKLGRSET